MADTFFEFDSSLPAGLDDNLADDVGHSLDGEEEEYDALNDLTFGEEVLNDDWEQAHEKLAEFTEQSRPHRDSFDSCVENGDGLELEKSLSRLVLEENEDPQPKVPRPSYATHSRLGDFTSPSPGHSVWGVNKNDNFLPASSTPILSRTPLPTKNVCTVEELERNLLTLRQVSMGRGVMSPNQSNRIIPPMPTTPGNSPYKQLIEQHAKRRDAPPPGLPLPLPLTLDHETHLLNVHNQRPVGVGGPLMVPKMRGFGPLMNRPDSNMMHPSNLPGGFALRGFPRKPHGNRPMPLPDQPVGLPVVLGNNPNPQFGLGPNANGMRPMFNHPMMPPMYRPNEMLPAAFGGPGGPGPRVPPHLAPHHVVGVGVGPHHNQRLPMPGAGPNHGQNHAFHKNYANFPHNHNHNHNHHQQHNQHNQHHRNAVNGAGDHDEYAGLMTTWQKQWLLNIQNLQLNVGPAYIADYYYTVYQHRKQRKEEEIKKSNEPKYPFNRRERSDSLQSSNWDRSNSLGPTKVYTPLQFENSLGKLQCGSVTAPRKLIDMEVMSPESNDGTQAAHRDTKKTKQLLLEIESMYLLLLKLEDALNPMAQTAAAELAANKILKRAMAAAAKDEERERNSDDEDEAEEDRVEEPPNPDELVHRLCSMLLQGDRLAGVLSIRKGKALLLRLLPHVVPGSPTAGAADAHADANTPLTATLASALFGQLVCGLGPLARRDAATASSSSEPLLPRFFPHFRRWLAASGLAQLLRLTTALVNDSRLTPQPARRALTVALGNKFGSSALSAMMAVTGEHLAQMSPEESGAWNEFLEAVVAVAEVARIPESGSSRPLEPLDPAVLEAHLARVKVSDQQAAVLKLALCTQEDVARLTATPPVS